MGRGRRVGAKAVMRAAPLALLLAGVGCASEEAALDMPPPSILAPADMKDAIAVKANTAPFDTYLEVVRDIAARELETPNPDAWDHGAIGHNMAIAQANAVLAWLFDDDAAAARAKSILLGLPIDFETNQTWDVNIRMPRVLMPYCTAFDLLRGRGDLSPDEAAEMQRLVTEVTAKFFDKFVDTSINLQSILGFAQNNHPIRTAASIGMVAITFPDHPQSQLWANWSVSELDYLLGPNGQYIQSDGGVSEGPFYYAFAYGPAIAFLLAMRNDPDKASRVFQYDCRNRQDADPWTNHGCQDGVDFTFDNPLDDPGSGLFKSLDWSLNLRLPNGYRPPLADANFLHHNGGAILTSFGASGHLRWDVDTAPPVSGDATYTWGLDLSAHHLVWVNDAVEPVEPSWRNKFMPVAGNAVFRSGWGADDRWLLLVAENGSARKTLHDHVDGLSFSLAAYGEYLLLDPGYHKPDELDNAVTADGGSHNTLLIDGHGAPEKGLLIDFGDADAFLENALDGDALAYAEAHQSYSSSDIERSVVFVRQRYFVVADRITTTATTPRRHTFRLGGWAGKDVGGTFDVWAGSGDPLAVVSGAKWERERAGVDVFLAAASEGELTPIAVTVAEPPYTPGAAPHVGAFDRERNVQDHGVIDGDVTALAPGFLSVLAPYRVGAAGGDDAPLVVTRLDAGGAGAAFTVESASGERELVWLRRNGADTSLTVDAAVFTTDAELTVVSLNAGFALMARGSEVTRDGTPILSGSDPVVLSEGAN